VCRIAFLGKGDRPVRLMAPQYVKPYVKRQKNDRADAEAISALTLRAVFHLPRHRQVVGREPRVGRA
jgi:transposase